MFDALNRQVPDQGLTPESQDFKVRIFLVRSKIFYLSQTSENQGKFKTI